MEEIDVRVPGQNYALVSFVSPTGAQKSDTLGFRLYGAFETLDGARAHAARVNAVDAAFDVYVVEMRRWCAWHPDPLDVADKVYSDKRLDEMIRAHRDAQAEAQKAHEERLEALALNQAGEKSEGSSKETEGAAAEQSNEDGNEAGGDRGVPDHAEDRDGVPDHVPE